MKAIEMDKLIKEAGFGYAEIGQGLGMSQPTLLQVRREPGRLSVGELLALGQMLDQTPEKLFTALMGARPPVMDFTKETLTPRRFTVDHPKVEKVSAWRQTLKRSLYKQAAFMQAIGIAESVMPEWYVRRDHPTRLLLQEVVQLAHLLSVTPLQLLKIILESLPDAS